MADAQANAGVAELADAQASGACGSNIVWVQVPSPASFFVSNQIPPAMDFPGGFLLYFFVFFNELPAEAAPGLSAGF